MAVLFQRGSGEIGRRTRLRIWRRKVWRFKSSLPHHTFLSFFISFFDFTYFSNLLFLRNQFFLMLKIAFLSKTSTRKIRRNISMRIYKNTLSHTAILSMVLLLFISGFALASQNERESNSTKSSITNTRQNLAQNQHKQTHQKSSGFIGFELGFGLANTKI